MNSININEAFESLPAVWSPEVLTHVNGQVVRIVKGSGELGWHTHEHDDKLLIVFKGCLTIQLHDAETVLNAGDMFVVPKGVAHCPIAAPDTHFMLIEPNNHE